MSTREDFWSRRRARVAEEERAEARARAEAERQAREVALAERSDEEILEELGLPDPDTLKEGDDFAAFLREAVPERLRRRALRRLWRSNPALANLDALVDYGDDFTDKATVVENLQTAYQVGRGMLRHVEALAAQAEADAEAEAEVATTAPEETPEAADAAATAAAQTDMADTAPTESETTPHTPDQPAPRETAALEEAEDPPPVPRRMRFHPVG